MSAYRYKRPSVPNEVRIIGRLTSDPEPEGAGVLLRLRVTYGISRVERMVLATGGGAAAARELHAGDLV
ncbi:MAG: hypothetical protein ACREMD_13920, partial [Gemmatimonadota bacterium]